MAEAHGFCAKMAHASVGRHTLLAFERENWARLPMTLGLAERTKQAGSAAFKLGKLDQAIALYTEVYICSIHAYIYTYIHVYMICKFL